MLSLVLVYNYANSAHLLKLCSLIYIYDKTYKNKNLKE